MSAALILDLINCIQAATETIEVAVPCNDFYSAGYKNSSIDVVNPNALIHALQLLIP
jgi:hypothetical protein